jgi:hypothetical protein
LQTKLAIGASNDPLEQEADRVADQVLAAPANPAVSGAPPRIQRSTGQPSATAGTVPASVDRVLESPGHPLDPALQQDMGQRFGHDFSRVRVHAGAAAEQSAQEVNANAYTVGHNIVFGTGRFVPGTQSGRRLLAHELTHVVQQSANIASLQRQRRGAAAGCGICMNDPRGQAAGNIAHDEVQDAFIADNPDIEAEHDVPGVPNAGVDLSYERFEHGQHVIFIGEIKPLDDARQQADIGRVQLQDYARELRLSGQFDDVFRMEDSPPEGPLFFENPMNPPNCPPQLINVQWTAPGLYQYHCEPPFSQLVRNPLCSCRPRTPDEEPKAPRDDVSVPVIIELAPGLEQMRQAIETEFYRKIGSSAPETPYVIIAQELFFTTFVVRPSEERLLRRYRLHEPSLARAVGGQRHLFLAVATVGAIPVYVMEIVLVLTVGGLLVVLALPEAAPAAAAAGTLTLAETAPMAGGLAVAETSGLALQTAVPAAAASQAVRQLASSATVLLVACVAKQSRAETTVSDVQAVQAVPLTSIESEGTADIGRPVTYLGERYFIVGRVTTAPQ